MFFFVLCEGTGSHLQRTGLDFHKYYFDMPKEKLRWGCPQQHVFMYIAAPVTPMPLVMSVLVKQLGLLRHLETKG